MPRYRCAACGSLNVVTDSQTGVLSFNYKKLNKKGCVA